MLTAAVHSDDPIVFPDVPAGPTRPAFPLVATLVPVVGGVALSAIIGSPFALMFAFLGPLVAVGGLLDQVRGGARRRRRAEADYSRALALRATEVGERHAREREALVLRHPDVAASVLRAENIWRHEFEGGADLVVGRGTRPSMLRATGDATRADASALRRSLASLTGAPVTVDWRRGLAVRGEPVIAQAVLRAFVLQLCVRTSPEQLGVLGSSSLAWEWMAELPHHSPGPNAHRLVVHAAGAGPGPSGTLMTWGPAGSRIDPRCGVVVDVREPHDAELVRGTDRTGISVEAVSLHQARTLARELADRARAIFGGEDDGQKISLGDVRDVLGVGASGGLAVALGRDGAAPVMVDLVRDGPHAVVTGITGSGKSELLTTWIAALAAAYSTREVVFLLADFKGGMTFDALAALPHVTGVITDLDGPTAGRAMASLRAEMRRREQALARVGARDISDPRIDVPRLVIVVDEFAALVSEHDGLQRTFADIAARGRALGMHVIIGSQRVAGSMPDVLLANCPLRMALRAADAADSRAVIGDDAAARLPGGAAGRGRALVRRAADSAPQPLRIALTGDIELERLVAGTTTQPAPTPPWLPDLPAEVWLSDLRHRAGGGRGVLLALADDPMRQRQFAYLLDDVGGLAVIGRAGSGKSSVVALIAAQVPGAVVVPHDLEAAWDALTEGGSSELWIVDDVDDLLARFPTEHAAAVMGRLERISREARLIVTARSPVGRWGRVIDTLPHRALLALSTRADHVAAGGDGALFRPDLRPGRGCLGGWDLQFARAEPRDSGAHRGSTDLTSSPADPSAAIEWQPGEMAGVVTRQVDRVAQDLRVRWGESARVIPVRELSAASRLADVSAAASALDRRSAAVETGPMPGVVLVGEGEDWLARWGLLQELRARHPLVVDVDSPAELRSVAGERGLAPYARPGAGRAWLCAPGAALVRVRM